jgi:uncharacterized cupredoxin-like copper-binding protein
MKLRFLVVAALVVAVTLGISTAGTAQTSARKVIEITMTSFKFEPSEIRVNEGDTVVIRLRNADARFPHNFASRYLVNTPLTVRGDGREGVGEDRKYVQVDAGKQAEFEFVAKGRGSYALICSVFTHAWTGMTGAIFVQPAGSP